MSIVTTLTTANAQWAVVDLHPQDSGVFDSYALSVQDGQQVGYIRVPDTFLEHASVWSGTAATWVDLHPGGVQSRANAVSAGQQSGYVYLGGISNPFHAALWSGSAATFEDLNPAGAVASQVQGSSAGQQAGTAWYGVDVHAGIWNGTSGSWLDLNPASALWSTGYDTDGVQQVGLAYLDANSSASVWSGTAASWVNLHPSTALASRALAVHGGQQVGWASYPIVQHAHLWKGTKASLVDLHPAGMGGSRAHDVHAGEQAGMVVPPSGGWHAAFWSGTAASFVDLHSFLPPTYTVSEAFGIWHSGNTTYVVGNGFNTATMHYHALMWVSPPEAAVWTDLGSALAGVSGLPELTGTGTLVAGTPMSLSLADAAPSAPTLLFVALSSTPAPFKGGTLVPVPPLAALSFTTSVAGEIQISVAAWPAGASGLSLFLQYAIQDASAVHGVALSNALRADVP